MNLDPKSIIDDDVAPPLQNPVEASHLTSPAIATTDDFVERINAMTPGEISAEQIRAVLAAANTANDGDPVETVRRDTDGKIAIRIRQQGVEMWRITVPSTGEWWNDTEPTLSWEKIAGPPTGDGS